MFAHTFLVKFVFGRFVIFQGIFIMRLCTVCVTGSAKCAAAKKNQQTNVLLPELSIACFTTSHFTTEFSTFV